jgi:hypothetical protein
MKSKLSTNILTKKERSLFMRTTKGQFALREWANEDQPEYVADRYQKALLDEDILVFPARLLSQFIPGPGLHPVTLQQGKKLLDECESMEFRERVRKKSIRIDREHPRYERAAVRPSVDQVLRILAKAYGLKLDDLLRGRRGKDNEPRRLGMYLVKELCDLKLQEIAERFGTGSYGGVGWACHGVASRMNSDARFRDRVDSIRRNCQQKT